ncbi:MAG: hypothetical protein WD187_00815 [Candidatus Woykebacteria bacterium]
MVKISLVIVGLLLIVLAGFGVYSSFNRTNYSVDLKSGWRTYTGQIAAIKFSFNYPTNLVPRTIQIKGTDYHTIGNLDLERNTLLPGFKDGDVLLIIAVLDEINQADPSHKNLTFTDAIFSGLPAKKAIVNQDNAHTLVYYVNGAENIRDDQFLVFDCHTSPPNNKDLINLCTQVADSFKIHD